MSEDAGEAMEELTWLQAALMTANVYFFGQCLVGITDAAFLGLISLQGEPAFSARRLNFCTSEVVGFMLVGPALAKVVGLIGRTKAWRLLKDTKGEARLPGTAEGKVGPAATIPEHLGDPNTGEGPAFWERGVFGKMEGTTYIVRAGRAGEVDPVYGVLSLQVARRGRGIRALLG